MAPQQQNICVQTSFISDKAPPEKQYFYERNQEIFNESINKSKSQAKLKYNCLEQKKKLLAFQEEQKKFSINPNLKILANGYFCPPPLYFKNNPNQSVQTAQDLQQKSQTIIPQKIIKKSTKKQQFLSEQPILMNQEIQNSDPFQILKQLFSKTNDKKIDENSQRQIDYLIQQLSELKATVTNNQSEGKQNKFTLQENIFQESQKSQKSDAKVIQKQEDISKKGAQKQEDSYADDFESVSISTPNLKKKLLQQQQQEQQNKQQESISQYEEDFESASSYQNPLINKNFTSHLQNQQKMLICKKCGLKYGQSQSIEHLKVCKSRNSISIAIKSGKYQDTALFLLVSIEEEIEKSDGHTGSSQISGSYNSRLQQNNFYKVSKSQKSNLNRKKTEDYSEDFEVMTEMSQSNF